MKTDEFTLKWKKENRFFKKQMKRQEVMAKFEEYIIEYSGNNTVSKKLAEIIPEVTQIRINWDNTAEVNQVYYVIDNKEAGFPIINLHSIVWNTWKDYCSEGEEIRKEEFCKIGQKE